MLYAEYRGFNANLRNCNQMDCLLLFFDLARDGDMLEQLICFYWEICENTALNTLNINFVL